MKIGILTVASASAIAELGLAAGAIAVGAAIQYLTTVNDPFTPAVPAPDPA